VRVNDIRAHASGRRNRAGAEARVLESRALSPVEDRSRDLVPLPLQLLLDLLDERAEVGVPGPWIHLGDEQDAHGDNCL
jgi:hypothetical protein